MVNVPVYFLERFVNKEDISVVSKVVYRTMLYWFVQIVRVCVSYIFASFFLSLKESTSETWENVFYFTSKALSVPKKIKF